MVSASCLAHRRHDEIRSIAPSSCVIASDEHHTVLAAGGDETFRIPWHSHDCLMILMPIRGAINFRDELYRDGTCLSEDRFVVVPKGREHAGEADNTPHILLYLTDSLMGRIAPELGSIQRIARRIRHTSFFAVTPEIRMLQYLCGADDSTEAAAQAGRMHVASALLIRVLGQIEGTEPLPYAGNRFHGEHLVKEICSFIDAHLSEEISLDVIADHFRVSRRHATRIFRRWTGTSIAEYLERQRIETARTMLANTTLSVGEIAWRLGYESGSALARAMRRVTGSSPSAIRGAGEQH